MERKGFFCYNSWLKALEPFGDAERGRIWTALLEYSNGLAIDGHSSGNERFILPMLIDQIDRDTQKNEKKSQTLKERQSSATSRNLVQSPSAPANPPKDKDKNQNKNKDITTTTTTAPAREDWQQCVDCYEQNIGALPRAAFDSIVSYLEEVEPPLVCEAIKQAAINNKRSWGYAQAILRDCLQKNITTRAAYLAEKERAKPTRPAPRQPDAAASARDKLRALTKGVTPDD